jgi:ribokinase
MTAGRITILGVFVADLAFWASRLPAMGETVMGRRFKLGPGGKGSNQSVAARRAGADVTFITKLGADEFGALARRTYAEEGIDQAFVFESRQSATGAAFIFVDEASGENAIVVAAGAVADLLPEEIDRAAEAVGASRVFLTQLELPASLARHGLEVARRQGVTTVLNPAPAMPVDRAIWRLVDVLTPNETEAAALTGLKVDSLAAAEAAADVFLGWGVGCVVVTLGGQGALLKDAAGAVHIPAFDVGRVVDTTGAGDAFSGGLAVGLAEGLPTRQAARFGCAVAGLSVTRVGTAPSMPRRAEIDALLARG